MKNDNRNNNEAQVEDEEWSPRPSTFFFPLSTNTEYFNSPIQQLQLVNRIKQASLLYENIVFQDGTYLSQVYENFKMSMVIPHGEVGSEGIAKVHNMAGKSGGPGSFFIDGHQIVGGELQSSFVSDFRAPMQVEKADDYPWFEFQTFELTTEGKSTAEGLAAVIRPDFETEMIGQHPFLQKLVIDNFSSDMVLCSSMGVPAAIDAHYGSMVKKFGLSHSNNGFAALNVTLPDPSALDWETIATVRETDSLVEFRQKMTDIEVTVRDTILAGEVAEANYNAALSQRFMQELANEAQRFMPNAINTGIDVTLSLVGAVIPVIGLPSTAISIARSTATQTEYNGSWLATFFRLTNRK